ncbi:acyl-CoA carboxylase epsilon subunit [Cellulomonas bogoriensis]
MTPQVRVVRGAPDDLELAALVAGLAAGADPGDHDHRPRTRRAAEARRRWRTADGPLDQAGRPGVDAWRWSGRTR